MCRRALYGCGARFVNRESQRDEMCGILAFVSQRRFGTLNQCRGDPCAMQIEVLRTPIKYNYLPLPPT